MKKIMFNDKYGLTEAVLSGKKTQTRRIIPKDFFTWQWDFDGEILRWEDCNGDWHDVRESKFAFHKGEIVAIAQSYKNAGVLFLPEEDDEFGCHDFPAEQTHGWNNKMFVRADLMPHQIRITNVRVERLQDISDEDVLKEGFELEKVNENMGNCLSHWEYELLYEDKLGRPLWFSDRSAQEAFSRLIDKVSGNGTWESNPYVFVYEFELAK